MTTFHSRQSGDARRTRKNENADTFNFTSQIPPSICAVMHTKHDKSDATIFKSLCKRTVVSKCFYTREALPLIFIRLSRLANSSPMNWRNPARRSRNGREPSHKKSGEMSRLLPRNFPAMAGQQRKQHCRISARATRETTRNIARNHLATAMSQSEQQSLQHPAKHLTSDSSKFWHHVFNHDTQ